MEQVEVEIVVETHSARYGVIPAGATLRTDSEYAAHLVDDHGAAKYLKPKAANAAGKKVAKADARVQTSALTDPYAHLGTLVAVVPGAADDAVQTSARPEEQEAAAAEKQNAESDK